MFWHSFPGPVIGGQVYRVPEENGRKESACRRENKTTWPNAELILEDQVHERRCCEQFWTSLVEDKFDLDNANRRLGRRR